MKTKNLVRVALRAGVLSLAVSSMACAPEPAKASVVNAFPAASPNTIVKVWYRTTLFTDAIQPGDESAQKPVGTGSEPAYALIALDYDPEAGTSSRKVPARTRDSIETKDDDQVKLTFGADTATGPCVGGTPMTQEEYDFIAQRIFPDDLLEPIDSVVCGTVATGDGGTGGAGAATDG